MIEIVGLQEGNEYSAALHLRRLLLNLWPDLGQSKTDVAKIFVGLKIYGQRVEDLDLVVIASFDTPRQFDVEGTFYPRDGAPFVPRTASVKNLALVVEVKLHDATGVRFANAVASVRYWKNGEAQWECVTEKNRIQMFAFKEYLDQLGVGDVWVQNIVLFMGLREADLPKRPHNSVAADASMARILNTLGQVSHPIRHERHAYLSFGSKQALDALLHSTLFRTLEPTPLDRRRMDGIAKSAVSADLMADLGKKQIVLRGRGGVGKTVALLQMAYRAFDTNSQRALVLTYNKALVADMRRTMALMGVPRSVEKGGIAVETVHALMRRLLIRFGLIDAGDAFLERYDEHKGTLVKYLAAGTISAADVARLRQDHAEDFAFDLVFVDEGQDWPSDEIEVLRQLFGTERLVISDGVDQYVRESVADWSLNLPQAVRKTQRLTRCLRMKANLAAFVGDVARDLGVSEWDLQPNTDAVGGRVLLVYGDLASNSALYRRLRNEAMDLGNYPVDMLGCVPPDLVSAGGSGCLPGTTLMRDGAAVWDGTMQDVRESFPTERDALRLVQYESCRGLEGWTVISYALDQFWDYKLRQSRLLNAANGTGAVQADETARDQAARWILIPLTRAIDTLVLNVRDRSHSIAQVLERAAGKHQDVVERISI